MNKKVLLILTLQYCCFSDIRTVLKLTRAWTLGSTRQTPIWWRRGLLMINCPVIGNIYICIVLYIIVFYYIIQLHKKSIWYSIDTYDVILNNKLILFCKLCNVTKDILLYDIVSHKIHKMILFLMIQYCIISYNTISYYTILFDAIYHIKQCHIIQ